MQRPPAGATLDTRATLDPLRTTFLAGIHEVEAGIETDLPARR